MRHVIRACSVVVLMMLSPMACAHGADSPAATGEKDDRQPHQSGGDEGRCFAISGWATFIDSERGGGDDGSRTPQAQKCSRSRSGG